MESISLFSGGMGLDLGLESAGFKVLCANEINKTAIETIRNNKPSLPLITDSISNISVKTISDAVGKDIKGIALVHGGPPCQAFSFFGKRKGTDDLRGQLVYEYIRMINEIRPKTFLMENVRGLCSIKLNDGSLLINDIFKKFEDIGYKVNGFLVNSVNYGAPQVRERLLLIGNKYNIDSEFPSPQYSNIKQDNLPPFKTLRQTINIKDGWVDPEPVSMGLSANKLKFLKLIPEGCNWRSLPIDLQKEAMGKGWYNSGGRSSCYRRLAYDLPAPTLTTCPIQRGTFVGHPTEDRVLTIGESAAIQEFPYEWKFYGNVSEKYKQIGNAVPTKLGHIAGLEIMNLLDKVDGLKEKKCKNNAFIKNIKSTVRVNIFVKKVKKDKKIDEPPVIAF